MAADYAWAVLVLCVAVWVSATGSHALRARRWVFVGVAIGLAVVGTAAVNFTFLPDLPTAAPGSIQGGLPAAADALAAVCGLGLIGLTVYTCGLWIRQVLGERKGRREVGLGSRASRAGDELTAHQHYQAAAQLFQARGNRSAQRAALTASALAAMRAGDAVAAEAGFREVLELLGTEPDREQLLVTLMALGACLIDLRRGDEARDRFAQALEAAESKTHRASALYNLAWVDYLAQRFGEAGRLNREAKAVGARTPDVLGLTALLDARLALRSGDLEGARVALMRAGAAANQLNDSELAGSVELMFGVADYLGGDRATGRERIVGAVPAHTTASGRRLAALWLAGLAVIADRARHTEDAAQFADQALALGGPEIGGEAERAAAYFLVHT